MSSPAIASFSQLGLSDPVLRAVYEVGYETPSPIQAAAIPPLLQGRDILGQAQTGTGKTAAFALPLLSRLDIARAAPQILVLTPTRELAIQVAEAFKTYARFLAGFRVLPVYGGQGYETQLRPLRRGVHAVVGTPGRVLDHLRRGTLALDGLATVVLDEADEMLRMGFLEDVGLILERTPPDKQLALFSATMPAAIRDVTRRHTRDAVEIRIESPTQTVSTVSQRYWQVSGMHKLDALTRILEVEDFDAMLIFVRTKIATAELANRLEARGFSAEALNGDMNQSTREQTVERLKAGRLDILVATDVAARGLDVQRISHVVNYDIPYDTEAYVHRIGRTARAGRAGKAILFVAPRERRMLRAIENATGQSIEPMRIPSREDIADVRSGRFKAAISEVLESQDLALFESVVASYQAEHDVSLGEIAAALAYMAQKERPLLPPEVREDRPRRADTPQRPPPAHGQARASAEVREDRPQRARPPQRPSPAQDPARSGAGAREVRPQRADTPRRSSPAQDPIHASAGAHEDRPQRADTPQRPSPAQDPARAGAGAREVRPQRADTPQRPAPAQDPIHASAGAHEDRPQRADTPQRPSPAQDPGRESAERPPDAPRKAGRAPPEPGRPLAPDCVRYRIEVGASHGAQPKNIVGAIANEAGLDGRHIDNIEIHDDFSTLDLPAGMPRDLFRHLKKVWVSGRQLRISVVSGPRGGKDAAAPPEDTAARRDTARAGKPPGKNKRGKKPKREKKRGKSPAA